MSDRLLYRPEDAAGILDLGRSRIFELMATGELESVKIGRSRRIPHGALAAFVERLRSEQARDLSAA